MKNRFICDLDDTLIPTSWLYSQAEENLVKLIQKNLGQKAPTREEILATSRKIDLLAVKLHGLSKDRFPASIRESYRQIAEERAESSQDIEEGSQQAYEVGMRVFNPQSWAKEMMPGARETLDFLVKQGDELYMVTAGDVAIQNTKIDFYGIRGYFGDRIQVTPTDKREAIRKAIGNYAKEYVWFVGDSPRSDIIPALECGIGAVHIPPKSTWSHNSHPLENEHHPRKITLTRIDEIISQYSSHFAH